MGIRGTLLALIGRDPGAPQAASPSGIHTYDVDDRRGQLRIVVDLCTRMSELYARNGDSGYRYYGSLADEARGLLTSGFDEPEVKALGARMPRTAGAPDWMNPKAIDNGLRVEPWQVDAAELHSKLAELAVELRATATY